MGREVRRVPLDFDWPLDKTWEGFLQPDSLLGSKCPDCEGGQTHAGWWLQTLCSRLGMLAKDVGDQERGKPLHPWLAEDPYPHGKVVGDRSRPSFKVLRPSADIVTLLAALTGDSEDQLKSPMAQPGYELYRKLVEVSGLDEWGICTTCEGEGTLEKYKERTDPPAGDGWQLWETVGEGSPISPVFATGEDLAQWMASPAYSWGASKRESLTFEQARNFVLGAGWAPSMVFDTNGLQSGEAWVGSHSE